MTNRYIVKRGTLRVTSTCHIWYVLDRATGRTYPFGAHGNALYAALMAARETGIPLDSYSYCEIIPDHPEPHFTVEEGRLRTGRLVWCLHDGRTDRHRPFTLWKQANDARIRCANKPELVHGYFVANVNHHNY